MIGTCPMLIETAGLGAPLERDEKVGGWRVTDLWQPTRVPEQEVAARQAWH